MRYITILAALAGLSACGYKEEDFADDYTVALCDKIFECTDESLLEYLPYASADECYTYGDDAEDTGGEDTCDFDSAAAKTCVDDTVALSCDDYNAGNFPSSCNDVCG